MAPRTSIDPANNGTASDSNASESDAVAEADSKQPPGTPSPRMRNKIFNQFCLPLSTGSDPIFDYSKLNYVWQSLDAKRS